MWFALVEAAKSVRAQRLHDADVDVGVVVLHERGAVDRNECSEAIEIVVEKLLAQLRAADPPFRRRAGKRCRIAALLCGPLVIKEVRLTVRSITLRDWKSRYRK